MIVMKFGGSSVANADRIRHVSAIIQSYAPHCPVIVLSAMGDTTDHLLEAADKAIEGIVDISIVEKLHKEAIGDLGISTGCIDPLLQELRTLLTGISMLRELTGRTKDYLVSFGERLSVRIMAAWLNSMHIEAVFFDAWDIGFISDSNFTSADLLEETFENIRAKLGSYAAAKGPAGIPGAPIPVVTGFIAKDENGSITTLGRGGSDLSATIIGCALNAEEIQTWKDVDGILTADPRIVKEARPVEVVTYEEAAELAYFGSQVLHPRSMQPCFITGTPVRVKNSYNPEAPGSLIIKKHTSRPSAVRAITIKKNATLIDLVSTRMVGQSGFLERVFDIFARHRLSVDVVATSEVSVSLTVDSSGDVSQVTSDLEKIASVEVKKGRAIVTIICDVSRSSCILAVAFGVLAKANINVQMISQGASKVNISMIYDDAEAPIAVQILHDAFFNSSEEAFV